MSQSDQSFNQQSVSDEEYIQDAASQIKLRNRTTKSYKEPELIEFEDNSLKRPTRQNRNENISQIIKDEMNEIDDENELENEEKDEFDQEEDVQFQETGVFYPDLDQILWRREQKDEQANAYFEYLVKYKDYSYLHLEWISEDEIVNDSKGGKNKLNRFNKMFDKKIREGDYDPEAIENQQFFDPTFIEVDRILHTSELFPVIHPKKAQDIRNKWTEPLMLVISKILNFSKVDVHYGVYFAQPVNPDLDNCANYRKIIHHPMDIGTILNRLYLDFYKNSDQFWRDVGLIIKNCRKYNKDPQCEIRQLCDTLRECSIILYEQWYQEAQKKYQDLLQKYDLKPDYNQEQRVETVKGDLQIKIDISKGGFEYGINSQKIDLLLEQFMNSTQNIQQQENGEKIDFKEQIKNFLKNNQLTNSVDQFDKLMNEIKDDESDDQKIFEQVQKNIKEQFLSPNCELQQKMSLPDQEVLDDQIKQEKSEIQEIQKVDNNWQIQKIKKEQIEIQEKKPKDMEISENDDQQKVKKKTDIPIEEIEKFNPGMFNFQWLIDENAKCDITEEETYHNWNYLIESLLIENLDLSKEIDKLYLVKWKNLSYTQSTWEHEQILNEYNNKINDFKQYNRALDKESRQIMMRNNNIHKTLLELEYNQRKRAKYSHHQINDLKNKLYFYDIGLKKQPYQYTPQSAPIFKGGRLLRDYQLESLNWLISSWYQKRNVILADEMGLGKTIQSIAFLNHLHQFEGCRGPYLIIAPLTTLDHWKRTGEDWTNLNCVLYYDSDGQSGREYIRTFEWLYTDISTKGSILQTSEIYKFTVLITSYEVFMQDMEKFLIQIPFQFIIIDEAHKLKNQNAKILQSLKKLPCKRLLLLTGTPIQNSTEELWSLLNFIEPQKFNDCFSFKQEYGELKLKEQVDKLQKQLKPFMLRRVKTDVEESIPPLQETIIDIEMTNLQKTIYRGLFEKNKNILQKNFSFLSATNTSLNNLEMQLRKCCNHPYLIKEFEYELTKDLDNEISRYHQLIHTSGKMILLDKLIQKFLKEKKKMLIFSQFTYVLVLLEDYLRYNMIKYEKIDGSIKARERQNSIDRFNNLDMKKEVFLLSTKAGGLGINLTAANVVIIYDSDWNPQNDVQATARAHRIGQKQEVTVYRFITKNTYESEMFERATKKLGQSQAVYGDGEFRQAGENQMDESKKPSKKEVEALLKKGMLSFLTQNEDEKMFEENIDDILQKRTRVATHNLISGNCSFSKTQFVSKHTDQNIDINDPNFWLKVLPKDSQTFKIRQELDTSMKKIVESPELQKAYMQKVQDQVQVMVETKKNVQSFNIDDQANLNYILNKISTVRGFNTQYRKAAADWVLEIYKPSRRFKTMNFQGNVIAQEDVKENVEQIFQDSDEQVESVEKNDNLNINQQITPKAGDDLLKKLCYYCERPNCSYYCQGHCKRAFHADCRHKIENGQINTDGPDVDLEPNELNLDADRLSKLINNRYICQDCQDNVAICFICKVKGKYFGYEPTLKSKKSKKQKEKVNQIDDVIKEEDEEDNDLKKEEQDVKKEDAAENLDGKMIDEEEEVDEFYKQKNELTKCSTANCQKFYHLTCIRDQKLFKYIDSHQRRFRCSLHYCQSCSVSGDSMAIAQCVRCHKAYHFKCLEKEKITKLAKKIILCQDHIQSKIVLPNTENKDLRDILGEDQFDGQIKKKRIKEDFKDTTIKMLKGENKEIRITRDQEVFRSEKHHSSKNKKKNHDKKEKRHHHSNSNNNKKQESEKEYNEKSEESVEEGEILTVKKKDKGKKPTFVRGDREREGPKYTYEELNLSTPKEFNYENYKKDWCKYCGARFSSNFTKGPWGPRTLCTVHYIQWNQKYTLDLSGYPELPKKPIKPDDLAELQFLSKKKQKEPTWEPKLELDELIRE